MLRFCIPTVKCITRFGQIGRLNGFIAVMHGLLCRIAAAVGIKGHGIVCCEL